MTVRSIRPCCFALLLLALLALPGCATFKNTPQQEYVWNMGKKCEGTGASITRVLPNGQYYGQWFGGAYTWPEFEACMSEQFRAHPYAEWLKTKQVAKPTS
jgi:hypothetical protein